MAKSQESLKVKQRYDAERSSDNVFKDIGFGDDEAASLLGRAQMTTSSIQLIPALIGIISIVWNITNMINGKATITGNWHLRRWSYFASEPICFSFQGGFNLFIGLALCSIFQIPQLKNDADKPIFWGCGLAVWGGLSLLSYFLGYAGQSWRDSHGIERITDPNKFRCKLTFGHNLQSKDKEESDPFS